MKTTPKKRKANRINGAKSKGPITVAGRRVVAKNNLRHGLLSNLPVVHGETEVDWQVHLRGVFDYYQPAGSVEVMLAERIALEFWRMRRADRFEAEACLMKADDAASMAMMAWQR